VLAALAALVLAAAPPPVAIRHPPGALHGFPSMSDEAGRVIADGELVQERRGGTLRVRARWEFADGRVAEERAEFEVGRALVQKRFSWAETRDGEVHRRFEVDFETGEASSLVTKDGKPERERAKLELPRGRSFAGYGTALAVAELPLERGGKDELTFVAFAPGPKAVGLEVLAAKDDPRVVIDVIPKGPARR
jgi:hypothetical protein